MNAYCTRADAVMHPLGIPCLGTTCDCPSMTAYRRMSRLGFASCPRREKVVALTYFI